MSRTTIAVRVAAVAGCRDQSTFAYSAIASVGRTYCVSPDGADSGAGAEALADLMRRWVQAIQACGQFMQQMNPWTGQFSTSQGYSPAMCVLIDFVNRLTVPGLKPRAS